MPSKTQNASLIISKNGLIETIDASTASALGYRVNELLHQPAACVLPALVETLAESTSLDMEAEMKRALKRGEFFLEYQPQFDVKTKKIVGFEALMRWQHPQRGLVPPTVFIPIAESSGLISKLCKFALDKALTQLKEWQKEGFKDLLIAVNLSAAQFRDEKLVAVVKEEIKKHKIKKDVLEFELTETLLMQDMESARQILKQLVKMGTRIAIDDFGVGYSSLNYLLNFPVRKIKIDKTFVQNMDKSPKNTRLVEAIINLGHALEMDVVAEGVEEEKQLKTLSKIRCDLIQGFLLGRPLEASAATKLLKEKNK